MVVALDCELMVFVCVGVMLCDIVATTPEIQNTKAMLALIGEMGDDAIARNLGLVGVALKTDITSVMIRVPFGWNELELFVGCG